MKEEETSPKASYDKSICLAEVSGIILGILGLLIFISGAGFWTVKPPGEKELCQVKILGLQNKTKGDQEAGINACHALYGGVFNMMHTISVPFMFCGALGLISAFVAWSAACASDAEKGKGYFKCGICIDVVGLVAVAAPSVAFASLAGIVAAGLAPIHAYFITIMVAHAGVSLSGVASTNSTGGEAARAYETLYLGYCAASRVELCLTTGSFCMMALFWVYVFDIGRNFFSWCVRPPNYPVSGCQLCNFRNSMKTQNNTAAAQE
jgi:hypothetical protein